MIIQIKINNETNKELCHSCCDSYASWHEAFSKEVDDNDYDENPMQTDVI